VPRIWVSCLLFALTVSAPALGAGPFDKAEYAARRGRLMEKIPDGAAVFLGATTPADDYEFRQGHDFLYFTGVEIPDAFLIVDGTRRESVLFFTMDEKTADGEAITQGSRGSSRRSSSAPTWRH
jgi:Xaa-Pro aminopeptidase